MIRAPWLSACTLAFTPVDQRVASSFGWGGWIKEIPLFGVLRGSTMGCSFWGLPRSAGWRQCSRCQRQWDLGGVIRRNGPSDLNSSSVLLLNSCAYHRLFITNTMFRHKCVHICIWHQDTLGRSSRIDLVVVSSDLLPVLDTQVKRRAGLSTDHHLVVRPGRPKRIVRVCCEHLAENPANSGGALTMSQGRQGTFQVDHVPSLLRVPTSAVATRWLAPVVTTIPEPVGEHWRWGMPSS